MKKCKWCNSNIEDEATVCPLCKANQLSTTNTQINHVGNFLEKHPNSNINSDNNNSYKTNNSHNSDENYIRQIAEDIKVIKNIIVVTAALYVMGAIYIALNVIW